MSVSINHLLVFVFFNFQFFVLDVVVNNTRLSNDNMYAQLRRIVRSVEECEEPEEPVGILTAARRDRWARARGTLMEGMLVRLSPKGYPLRSRLFSICKEPCVMNTFSGCL